MKKKTLIIPYLKIKRFENFFENKKIVLVGGCFDLIHYGHLKFLERAKKRGDFLIVALESDEFIIKSKKRIPIHNQKQRAEILSHIDFVDMIILLPFFSSDNDYFEMVKKIKPKIIAVTFGDPQLKNKKKQAKTIGAKVKVVTSLLDGFSTTEIINKLKEL